MSEPVTPTPPAQPPAGLSPFSARVLEPVQVPYGQCAEMDVPGQGRQTVCVDGFATHHPVEVRGRDGTPITEAHYSLVTATANEACRALGKGPVDISTMVVEGGVARFQSCGPDL